MNKWKNKQTKKKQMSEWIKFLIVLPQTQLEKVALQSFRGILIVGSTFLLVDIL